MDSTEHDFGTLVRGEKAEHVFMLRNNLAESIHIVGIRLSCGCARVPIPDEQRTIHPGTSVPILVVLDTSSLAGARSTTVCLAFDKPSPGEIRLHLNTYVRSDVRVQPGAVEFGAIRREASVEKTLQVSSSGRYSWGIVEVKSHPHVTCQVIETRRDWNQVSYRVQVRLGPEAPPGYFRGQVTLVTNEPQNREIAVPIEAHVLADLSVSPATLFLGVVAPGEEVSRQLVVRASRPFAIRDVKADGTGIKIGFGKSEVRKPLYLIPVKFQAGEEAGRIERTIHIQTDLEGGAISVPASAVVATPQQPASSVSEAEMQAAPKLELLTSPQQRKPRVSLRSLFR